ncbi:MAG: PIN domain-containing protein [Planctomycetota bacterium]
MRILFDTSTLVTAVVSTLPHHNRALACYRKFRGGGGRWQGFCTTHALAEAYATLTAMPLVPRISPADAARLIRENFSRDLTVLPLSASNYAAAVERVAALGLGSGVIYDALHLIAAERHTCKRVYTYNLADFSRLGSDSIEIVAP